MKKIIYGLVLCTIIGITTSAYGWFVPTITSFASRLSSIVIGSHREQTLQDRAQALKSMPTNEVQLYRFGKDVQGAMHGARLTESQEKELAKEAHEVMQRRKSLQESWQIRDFEKGLRAKLVENQAIREERVSEELRSWHVVSKPSFEATRTKLDYIARKQVKERMKEFMLIDPAA